MIEIIFIRQAIALVGTALAAYTDIRTGLIFDEITYPMIFLGLFFSIAEFNFSALLVALAVFAVGYILYFAGKIGGGDVKLFSGLALLVPFGAGNFFVLNVLVISGLASVIFVSVYYVAKYVKSGIDLKENRAGIVKAAGLLVVFFAYFYFAVSNSLISGNFAVFVFVPLLFALVFVSFERGIKKKFFLKKINLEDIEEDDLIAQEFLDENTRKELSLKFKGIADRKVLQKLRDLNVKQVLVYRDLPKFAPFVLVGVVVSIIFPDFLMRVFL